MSTRGKDQVVKLAGRLLFRHIGYQQHPVSSGIVVGSEPVTFFM